MPPAANAAQTLADVKEAPDAPVTSASPEPVSAPQAQSGGRVTELRVSANLMTLETGVYCVFPAPGSRSPDPGTGLPGVRITRCPGMAGRPEAVSISTFREDGWLDNTAALVRVSDGPAQVLVTIYQAGGQPADNAPRLQVLRLAGDPAVAGPEQPVAAPKERDPEVMAHVQGAGDVPGQFGDWIGKPGSRAWVEGFGISDKGPVAPGDMEYQGVLGRGWLSPWVENGKFCGSRGMALPLLGLNVRLKGAAAKQFKVRYSATFIDGSAVGPTDEGTACEAPGLAAMEAFQIELIARAEHSAAGEPAEHTTTDRVTAARPSASRAPAPRSPARSSRH
jgi:Clostridial hydrophobic W